LAVAFPAALALSTVVAQAQMPPAPPPPTIFLTTSSDVKVTPDRATVRISVQTKQKTAVAAAAENARKQSDVLDALRKLGISNESISTTDYNVNPDYRYEQNKDPILVGYIVTNTVVVDVQHVDKVGSILDAALGAGANMISSLDFYASNTEAARQRAIGEAMAKAKSEAEAVAKAAGGTVTGLLEVSVSGEASYPPPPRPMYRMQADMASTPISPGQQSLNVSVSTRWTFSQGR